VRKDKDDFDDDDDKYATATEDEMNIYFLLVIFVTYKESPCPTVL
jgi:hypothetical protein